MKTPENTATQWADTKIHVDNNEITSAEEIWPTKAELPLQEHVTVEPYGFRLILLK